MMDDPSIIFCPSCTHSLKHHSLAELEKCREEDCQFQRKLWIEVGKTVEESVERKWLHGGTGVIAPKSLF